ncbi:hypothetical protein KY284_007935 [Solanum tuberosum]|nr:hypothetical protein KY284_007935 [Solanum tuberosum]
MEVQRYCDVRGMLRAAACDVRSCCDGDGDVRAAATATCELLRRRCASCEQRETEARGTGFT